MGKGTTAMTLYQVELSPSAKDDLEDIAHYTVMEYGVKQQELYMTLILKGFQTISENPYIGHAHADLSDTEQVWKVGKHIIVYSADDDKNIIYVMRVLHQNTDVKQHIYGAN